MSGLDILTAVTRLSYFATFAAAVLLLVRHRSAPARWVVSMFASIDAVILVTLVRGDDADPLEGIAGKLLILVLLLFPWLLFRFADSIVRMSRPARMLGDVVGLATAASALVVTLPAAEADRTSAQAAWVLVIVLVWFVLSGWAAVAMWRARRGQPGVVNRRLRLLSVGALAIGLALIVGQAGSSNETEPGQEGEVTVGEAGSQLLASLSGVLFLIGFAPPQVLRSAWRHGDERELYEAAVSFLGAQDEDEILSTLLPRLRTVLGAPAVALLAPDGTVRAADGDDRPPEWADARTLQLHNHTLAIHTSPSMPLLGGEEQEMLDRMGLMAELALDRTSLLRSEQAARRAAESAAIKVAVANDKLEHANTQLQEVNDELASVNDQLESFVYTTSHDLKNPLIALLGYVEVLEEDLSETLPEDARYYLTRMTANVRHMEALINDLLELSRVGRVEQPSEAIDLDVLVDQIGHDTAQLHPGARIERGDLPALWASPVRIRQILTNLVENACRYAGRDDVTITIRAEQGSPADNAHRPGARLVVQDDGQGIPPDQLERVFGVFERLDPTVEGGTGMGLAICRRIMDSVGGSIRAVPSGVGARFEIDLPPDLVPGASA